MFTVNQGLDIASEAKLGEGAAKTDAYAQARFWLSFEQRNVYMFTLPQHTTNPGSPSGISGVPEHLWLL